MMTRLFCISVVVLFAAMTIFSERTIAGPPTDPVAKFSTAKRLARNDVYKDHQITLYCGCKYKNSQTASGGKISNTDCGYRPRKNETRGKRLEWEHIMPASYFGRLRTCWKNGHRDCVNSKGESYKGRKCCAKADHEFERMESDLHNLAPTVGELNGDRSALAYGIVSGEPREYGKCDFEIDRSKKVTEPAANVRGNVARVWLYMSDAYGIHLTPNSKKMFEDWSKSDPPDEWERERDARIKKIQGNSNPFIGATQ